MSGLFRLIAALMVIGESIAMSGLAEAEVTDLSVPETRAEIIQQKLRLSDELLEADARVEALSEERLYWEGEQAWLNAKLKRLADEERDPPLVLIRSAELKQRRIQAIGNELGRMISQKESAAEAILNLSQAVTKKFGSPSWWRLPPDVARAAGIGPPLLVSGGEEIAAEVKTATGETGLEREIDALGLGEWVELTRRNGKFLLETRLPILFSSGRIGVAKEYHKFFQPLADFLKKYAEEIRVTGFTDPKQIHTRTYPSNFELGARRAANVMHVLAKYGVDPAKFVISSYGSFGGEDTDAGKGDAIRRRVEITAYLQKTAS